MSNHHKVNYFEFPCQDIPKTKAFFNQAFGWDFVDYGPDYCAITGAGLDGGFFTSDKKSLTADGATMVVLFSESLEDTYQAVVNAGGSIIQEVFEFPGGKRFHFTEPSGNEFAVWAE